MWMYIVFKEVQKCVCQISETFKVQRPEYDFSHSTFHDFWIRPQAVNKHPKRGVLRTDEQPSHRWMDVTWRPRHSFYFSSDLFCHVRPHCFVSEVSVQQLVYVGPFKARSRHSRRCHVYNRHTLIWASVCAQNVITSVMQQELSQYISPKFVMIKKNKKKTIQAQPSLPIIPGSGSVKSLFIVMTFTSFPLNRDWVENNWLGTRLVWSNWVGLMWVSWQTSLVIIFRAH